MMVWPSDLPPPERSSWNLTPQDARRKRQADAGPPGYRRRFSNVGRTVSLSLILTRGQKAAFEKFFYVDCKQGAEMFRMPDPTTDGWPMFASDGGPLVQPDGTPLLLSASWVCLWGETLPAETIVGREFRKSFDVVVMP